MKINKQLFEDVLSGKLKGTFVLRDGKKITSDNLQRTPCGWLSETPSRRLSLSETHPYLLVFNPLEGCRREWVYKSNGGYMVSEGKFCLDIVDFIPDTDMKENELKIQIPEGQEIDWQESAKQEKIVFKKKDTKPRSWEEYCNKFSGKGFFIDFDSQIVPTVMDRLGTISDRNVLPSKELAEAFLAMMQLISLRQAWIGDWEPDWCKGNYCVAATDNGISASVLVNFTHPLSFPTKEMAEDFMYIFKDLLEIAKPLI